MVTNKVVPAVLEVVGEDAIWEDDNAVIPRTVAAMEACGELNRGCWLQKWQTFGQLSR